MGDVVGCTQGIANGRYDSGTELLNAVEMLSR